MEIYLSYSVSHDGTRLVLDNSTGLTVLQRERFAELNIHQGLGGSSASHDEQVILTETEHQKHADFAALQTLGAKAYLSHPLRAGPRLLGMLVLVSLSRPRFEQQEVRFIHTVCDLAAASVERARLLSDMSKARDLAEAANQAKDDFLAAVSHELRTPLNPVLLLASDRADDETQPGEIRADFDTIAKNVLLEARLIDDLLDLARVAHAKLALQMRTIDVHAVLTDALTVVRADLTEKHIDLRVESHATNSVVQGDPLRLQQVFWNVLRNAVKFTPAGGTITVATHTTADQSKIEITISDSGIGMTPEELGGTFVRFAQGDHAKTGSPLHFGGLGLGLSISRMLVEAHSGRIGAASPGRGQGTTFLIELPLVDRPAPKSVTNPVAPPSLKSVPKATPALRRLLLVEDHEPTRTALARLLVRRHYEVATAGSLAEARVLAARQKFDLLICDIGLPDGSGCELMSELNKDGNLKGIAVTGYGEEADIARSLAAGFSTHITKPLTMRAFAEAIVTLEAQSQRPSG